MVPAQVALYFFLLLMTILYFLRLLKVSLSVYRESLIGGVNECRIMRVLD